MTIFLCQSEWMSSFASILLIKQFPPNTSFPDQPKICNPHVVAKLVEACSQYSDPKISLKIVRSYLHCPLLVTKSGRQESDVSVSKLLSFKTFQFFQLVSDSVLKKKIVSKKVSDSVSKNLISEKVSDSVS